MIRRFNLVALVALVSSPALPWAAPPATGQTVAPAAPVPASPAAAADGAAASAACRIWSQPQVERDPTEHEIRCRYSVRGPGRFGLSEYMEAPVYQPATPLPGTHVVGVPALPGPRPGESFEEWEWRVLRTQFGPQVRTVMRDLELLDPVFAERLIEFENRLRAAGVHFSRRETWRSPERQAWLFQQGRSRPGPLVTATLTSWHSAVDERGVPSAKAADYNVARGQMHRFHEVAWAVGLESYGPESNDPGHVYLPGSEGFPTDQLVFLRLLPRVPHVTLSTGRPTDEAVSRALRDEYRAASLAFAWEPFFPRPAPKLAQRLAPVTAFSDTVAVAAPVLEIIPDRPQGALAALFAWVAGRW